MDLKILCLLLIELFTRCYSMNPRVLELNDGFIDVKKDGHWLVMFYAPWCVHCKRLEPIWSHVQQSLHNSGIRVCRLDCITYKSTCQQFQISTYPTIKFIKGNEVEFVYNGDRVTEDIVHFALRVSNPPIRRLKDKDSLNQLIKDNTIFFTYLGESTDDLWDVYSGVATTFQPYSYFYHAPTSVAEKLYSGYELPAVVVHKENNIYQFDENEWDDNLNSSLHKWVNEERFPTFVKVTRLNINSLMKTKKYLVLAIVEESKVQEIPQHMMEFRNMVESVIKNYRNRFHRTFQFGWIGSPDLANSIAIMKVPLPYLIVLNSTNNYHHIPDDEPHQLTPEAIAIFLESILNQTAKTYGGSNFLVSLYRIYFESMVMLTEMWKGNPVLTTVIFGLPSGFLMLICYSIHCTDILDADEDDIDDDSSHEKKE